MTSMNIFSLKNFLLYNMHFVVKHRFICVLVVLGKREQGKAFFPCHCIIGRKLTWKIVQLQRVYYFSSTESHTHTP